VIGLLGILKAGGAFVPLDPAYPPERLGAILDDVRPPVVLAQEALTDRLPTTTVRTLSLAGAASASEPTRAPRRALVADNLAYVMYTSGSTGRPKGTGITHRNVVRFATTPSYARFTADDAFLLLAPVAFDASTLELWAPLLNGGRLVIFPPGPPSLADLGSFIERHQVTGMWLTTGLFTQMVERQAASLRGLRWLFAGGDAVSPRHVRDLLDGSGRVTLVNGYGPMENTVFTCCHPMTSAEGIDHDVPLGPPIANTQVHLLDPYLRPVPVGVAGELCGGGDGVGRGFYGQPGQTAARFVPDPCGGVAGARLYRSGDLARWRDDGLVQFRGRLDWQVKIRGYRVDLGELEATLEEHPAVATAVVVPREDSAGTKRLVAYLVPDGPRTADEAAALILDLRERLRARLPDYMVPSSFQLMDALPLTPNGKVDRRALPEPAGPGHAELVPPRDPVELQLVHIWEEVLGRRGIGTRDNFFELGGHSILAISLVARIDQQFGRRLAVASVMERPTIELQADVLRAAGEPPSPTPIVAIQPRGARPPLFCVHPGGGTAFCYLPLAFHLGADQPLYGIQSVGLGGEQAPLTRVEEMASRYLEAVRKIQPEGPYQLAGWSLGGMVAFEMARQLRDRGEPVALLALLDTYGPSRTRVPADIDDATILRGLAREVADWSIGRAPEAGPGADHEGDDLLALAKAIHLLPSDASERHLRWLLDVFKANLGAAVAYRPAPYEGDVTLLRAGDGGADAADDDPTLGWGALVGGRLEVVPFAGDHFGPVREPSVQVIADMLRRRLVDATRPASA
jgi:aspartate racemase